MGEDASTRVLPKQSTRPLASSEKAIDAVEATRMRGLMQGIAISSAIVVVIVMMLGGDPFAVRIHAGALAASAVVSGTCAILFRNPKRYVPRLAFWVIFGQVGVLITGYYFWGIFSAYLALMPLSIYIAAGTATTFEMILGLSVCVVAQTSLQLATIFGWIQSRGLVEPVAGRAAMSTQLIAVGLLQLITIGSALAGRAARKETQKALEAHDEALIELARREALLAEAYADARAAREAALGGGGRFSDHQIDGFELGRLLGRGAMGKVYEAKRISDDLPVAFKMLAPHLLRELGARDRFLRESAIVTSLTSKNIVRVLAVSPDDAPLPYLVMERLEGTDLAQLMKRGQMRSLDEIRDLVVQIARGLDAAHLAGVVHRDLKPSNLYAVGPANARTWKLLDFGASKWSDGSGTLTRDDIVGTPGHMAPEQALGRAVDMRSDVYAFGVLIYRLLTGVPAVIPSEIPAMLQEVSYCMPVRPSKRAPVSPQLEAVLAVALAKSPDRRFGSAGELAEAFVEAAAGRDDKDIARRAAAILADTPWGAWQKR